jgi:chromate transporter
MEENWAQNLEGGSQDGEAVRPPRLREIAWQFLKIGATGFGGGVAVIALLERECVQHKRWLTADEFVHGVSLGQILGSFAVNTSFFVGYRLRGLIGGLVAMVAFLAPSVTLVIGLSWLYFATKKIPSIQQAMLGATPVVIALIASAGTSLGKNMLRGIIHDLLAFVGLAGTLYHVPLLELLTLGALVGIVAKLGKHRDAEKESVGPGHRGKRGPSPTPAGAALPLGSSVGLVTTGTLSGKGTAVTSAAAASFGLGALLFLFLKVGCGFFGGGYVLVPLLQHELVLQRGLLTVREFVDGVAISQLTPGPIAVLATFVGYRFGGALGAILATVALYIPATVLMAGLSRAYTRLRHLSMVKHLLGGLGPVIVGMIFASAVQLAPHSSLSLEHPLGIILCAGSYLLMRRNWHPALLLAAGAALGSTFPSAFIQ